MECSMPAPIIGDRPLDLGPGIGSINPDRICFGSLGGNELEFYVWLNPEMQDGRAKWTIGRRNV
jgi:hypothetical protein